MAQGTTDRQPHSGIAAAQVLSPAVCLPLAQCDGHRAVAASALNLVEQQLGVTLPHAINASGWSCPVSAQSFLAASAQGQRSWLNVPQADLLDCLKHYVRAKRRAPLTTTACVWVHAASEPAARKYLAHMSLVHTFPVGTKLLQHSPPLTESVLVYFDYPAAPYPRVSALNADGPKAIMTFDGSVNKQYASILLDSGATHNFIDSRLAAALGVPLRAVRAISVQLADDTTALITSCCTVRLRIQGYNASVSCFVLDMGGAHDVILGDDWLVASGASLNYGQRTCVLPTKAGPRPLYPADSVHLPAADGMFLNAAQVRRAMRTGARTCMVLVKWVEGMVGAAAAAVTTAPAPDSAAAQPAPTPLSAASAPDALAMPTVSAALRKVLKEFWDRFQEMKGLPPYRNLYHTIPLESEAKPPFKPLYRLSPAEMEEVEKQIADLLKKGLIEPSTSPFGAPILFVGKKDGTLRMVIDYRALNKITVKNKYALPLISQLMDQLQGAKVFSALDLQSGYHQLRITPEDVPKTAFRTPFGHFQFKVLSFGLCNAPATFQAAMHDIFRPLLTRVGPNGRAARRFVAVYLDDILIYSPTPEDHISDVREVLSILRQHDFYVKLKKCEFEKSEVKFLGHLVGAQGVRVDPDKVRAVVDWTTPKNLQELRSFLGLATYFRKFILGFAAMVAPLHKLTGVNVPFVWSPQCQTAFDAVKEALTTAPTLRMPDPSLPYELICDASGQGVGAVLLQEGQPLAYESRAYKPAERNYPTTEQELLAVVHALTIWRCFLEGGKHPVRVVTDHNPLVYLPTQASLSRRQARWSLFLARFNIEWEYRPGRKNVADPLSRHPSLPLAALRLVATAIATRGQKDAAEGKERVYYTPSGAAVRKPNPRPVDTSSGSSSESQESESEHEREPSPPKVLPAKRPQRKQQGRGRAASSKRKDKPAAGNADVPEAVEARGPRAPAPVVPEQPQSQEDPQRAAEQAPADSNLADALAALREGYTADPWFQDPENTKDLIATEDGRWLKPTEKGELTVVPSQPPWLRAAFMHELHDTPYSGHPGTARTIAAVERLFWWPTLKKDVTAYVTACPICQRDKPSAAKPPGALKPLPIPDGRWKSIGMDFICGLPLTPRGHNAIFLVIDRLTKMVHMQACNMKGMSSTRVARLLVDTVVKHHGVPESIVCDRDPKFSSGFMVDLMKILRTKMNMSTAYHPQSDGLTERANRTLQDMLRHYVGVEQTDWDEHLALAEFAINNAYNESTGSTPFRLNYGEDPRLPFITPVQGTEAKFFLKRMADDLERAKRCLDAAQQRMKLYYDKNHRPVTYAKGDWALLSTKDITLKYNHRKLKPKWLGPFQITKVINSQAYQLDLRNPQYAFHNVFHVSKLRPWREPGFDRDKPPQPPVAVSRDDGAPMWEVERVVKHVGTGRNCRYLVKWVGYPLQDQGNPLTDRDNWLPKSAVPDSLLELYQEYLANTTHH